jgi:transcriptional regulator with XRE-family HTH domain
MSERKNTDPKLQAIGELIKSKRIALGNDFKSRENFIFDRGSLFNNEEWMSVRYLSNIELGKNLVSIPKLIELAFALEEDPVDLFTEIYKILYNV